MYTVDAISRCVSARKTLLCPWPGPGLLACSASRGCTSANRRMPGLPGRRVQHAALDPELSSIGLKVWNMAGSLKTVQALEDFRLRDSHATRSVGWGASRALDIGVMFSSLRIARLVLRGCPARPFFAGPTAQVGVQLALRGLA